MKKLISAICFVLCSLFIFSACSSDAADGTTDPGKSTVISSDDGFIIENKDNYDIYSSIGESSENYELNETQIIPPFDGEKTIDLRNKAPYFTPEQYNERKGRLNKYISVTSIFCDNLIFSTYSNSESEMDICPIWAAYNIAEKKLYSFNELDGVELTVSSGDFAIMNKTDDYEIWNCVYSDGSSPDGTYLIRSSYADKSCRIVKQIKSNQTLIPMAKLNEKEFIYLTTESVDSTVYSLVYKYNVDTQSDSVIIKDKYIKPEVNAIETDGICDERITAADGKIYVVGKIKKNGIFKTVVRVFDEKGTLLETLNTDELDKCYGPEPIYGVFVVGDYIAFKGYMSFNCCSVFKIENGKLKPVINCVGGANQYYKVKLAAGYSTVYNSDNCGYIVLKSYYDIYKYDNTIQILNTETGKYFNVKVIPGYDEFKYVEGLTIDEYGNILLKLAPERNNPFGIAYKIDAAEIRELIK